MTELKKLAYDHKALIPYISWDTMDYHYDRHLATYVANYNKLTDWTEYANKTIDEVITLVDKWPIFNNWAQILNHDFYFEALSPVAEIMPNLVLLEQLIEKWGSLDKFKEEFNKMAVSNFWSGWTWLVMNNETNELSIVNTQNAGTTLTDKGLTSLLVCDVWEHAYYIDYRNNRAKYLDNFWKVLDWKVVEKRIKR